MVITSLVKVVHPCLRYIFLIELADWPLSSVAKDVIKSVVWWYDFNVVVTARLVSWLDLFRWRGGSLNGFSALGTI